ncbi:MAG: hypothetical protein RL600_420 [Actinomycetota bacterium]|jgi:hypothetical protein
MSFLRKFASASICLGLLFQSGAAHAGESIQKVLSDHPGSATALTGKQKSEIKYFVKQSKGRKNLVCTGLSLTGQRKSMYRVVRLRAELVCEYALSLDSSFTTTIEEKTTKTNNRNGRVLIASR